MMTGGRTVDTSDVAPLCDPRRYTRSAFSLAELLIVVLVVGIVSMVGIPLVGGAAREARLSRATADVVSALEYARACATASRADVRVHFPEKTGLVVVERWVPSADILAGDTLIPEALIEDGVFEAVPHPLDKRTNAFVFVPRGDGLPVIDSVDFGGTNAVVFQAYGVPSSAGRITLVLGSLKRIIAVHGGTGQMKIGD